MDRDWFFIALALSFYVIISNVNTDHTYIGLKWRMKVFIAFVSLSEKRFNIPPNIVASDEKKICWFFLFDQQHSCEIKRLNKYSLEICPTRCRRNWKEQALFSSKLVWLDFWHFRRTAFDENGGFLLKTLFFAWKM